MDIRGCTAFVTGAAGGMGREWVRELRARGAAKVYAADLAVPAGLPDGPGASLVPLALDITDPVAVERAARMATDVTLLINNAGVNLRSPFIAAPSLDAARREMEVNYFGTLAMCRAFAPVLAASAGASAIVNVLSILGKVTLPNLGTYCATKAALLRLCEGVRAELAPQGTAVLAVLPWAVDTPMSGPFPGVKTAPSAVAAGSLDALEAGREDVVFHEFSEEIERRLREDPKALEHELAGTFRRAP